MLAIKSCFACFARRKFEMDLSPPPDIEALFKQYSENNQMKLDNFQKFLREVQHESKSDEEVLAIMSSPTEKGHLRDKLFRPNVFNLDSFFAYLFNELLNPPISSSVHHDMTQPMSHYFIYTGHNSYLTGNQLSSDCSEKPIIEALHRGVRVIELDLWPNSDKTRVLVLHGRTLTAPVDFEKCIVAIKENAFVKSEYPVVITFEDHLPAPLQAQVAEIVHRVIGDTLYYPDGQEGFVEFPSPEDLKKRILISTKPPKEYLSAGAQADNNAGATAGTGQSEQTEPAEKEEPWGEEILDSTQDCAALADEEAEQAASQHMLDVDLSYEEKPPEKQDESKVAPEYKRIITIRAGKPQGDSLKDSLIPHDKYARRVSLSNPQLSKVSKAHPDLVLSFTQKNLLRIYPYGLRVDSSNYNPFQAWAHGAQMVAFNMQGYGRPLWLVHGLFRANGGCGYVKKPNYLLSPIADGSVVQSVYDPQPPGSVKKTLKVKVFMGQGWKERFSETHFDTFSPPDFYTRVGIAGVKADTIMKKTKTKLDDWTPHWNEEFEFPLRAPELALMRVEVHEYDAAGQDDFGGQTCLPVSELKPGIRTVPLYDKKGRDLSPVRLLMSFSFIE